MSDERRESYMGYGVASEDPDACVSLVCSRIHTPKLTISDKGKAFIKGWESIYLSRDKTRSFYYNDSAGYCTVGWGHLVNGHTSCGDLGIRAIPKVTSQSQRDDEDSCDSISMAEAHRLFDIDKHKKAEDRIKRDVKVPLYQYEFDALCSLAFNVGALSMVAPRLLKLINAGNYERAPYEFLDINKANGVVERGLDNRRKSEFSIFAKNIYNSKH